MRGGIDYLVFDFLAEITMSLLARARAKSPDAGYAPDFVRIIASLAGELKSRGIKVVQFKLDRSQGNRAAFVRNDRIVNLKPVEAIVCEGSGIQSNFAQKLRAAGVPLHIFRRAQQRSAAAA